MSTTPRTDRIYFPHLDVVRFLAAFMIVIVHAYEAWHGWFGEVGILSGGTYKTLTPAGEYVDTFIRNSGIGVDIFFLISGFLITYILLEEKKNHGTVYVGKFMLRRAIRIWPLYFFLVALSPLLVSWINAPQPHYLENIFFVGNFEVIGTEKWLFPFAHFWSICVEEHFYVLWPFIIYLIPRRHLFSAFLLLISLSIGFRIYAASTLAFPWYTLYLHTLSRIDVLVIGAIGAWYYSENRYTFQISRLLRILLYVVLIVSLSLEATGLWSTVFLAGFKKYFYMAIIAVLLLDYNFNPGYRHRLRPKSFVHYLGKVSYGIYMYSNIVLAIVIDRIMLEYHIRNIWMYYGIVIGLSLLIPIISYELFEKHLLKLNRRLRVIATER